MKQLYLDIKTQLEAQATDIVFIQLYNNQFALLKSGNATFARPAVFVEFIVNSIMQLGGGIQLYDLTVRLHICHDFLNGDNMGEDLDVYDLAEEVYAAMQAFETTGSSAFVRIGEKDDDDYTNIYHYMMDFGTTYIDATTQQPINSIQTTPPTGLDISGVVVDENPVDY